jgi:hypothetical protein
VRVAISRRPFTPSTPCAEPNTASYARKLPDALWRSSIESGISSDAGKRTRADSFEGTVSQIRCDVPQVRGSLSGFEHSGALQASSASFSSGGGKIMEGAYGRR